MNPLPTATAIGTLEALIPPHGRGRSHGTSKSTPFDRWFRYPAGFASDYVERLLDRIEDDDAVVADCFAGSGVTGTAARSRGMEFVGFEAHPMIAELAQIKLTPSATHSEVQELAATVRALAKEAGPSDVQVAAEPDLVQRSFESQVLRDLMAIRSAIKSQASSPASTYLKWALLGTLRDVASVKVGWPYQRPGVARRPRHRDPFGRFSARVQYMIDDLRDLPTNVRTATVFVGDSRDSKLWELAPSPVTACIASPPYLNNFDYADATRLEAYFWGDITTWRELTTDIRADMLTATTQQSSRGEKLAALNKLEATGSEASAEVLALVREVEKLIASRGKRSKEYDQVVPSYFVAMIAILANVHRHLKPSGEVVWLVGDSAPYGAYIDTPRLIGALAEDLGFKFTEDVTLRQRGNRWSGNTDRHDVKLTERMIVLQKGGSA